MLQTTNNAATDMVHGVTKEEFRRMEDWLKRKVDAGKVEKAAEVVTLTPCLAKLLLARNPINRPIGVTNLGNLTADIANKRWEFNGESITVSRTGVLLNGQHRCTAVVDTGRSIETVIAFGAKDDARFTIDTGKPKNISNFLSMKERKYTSALGPAISYVLQWREFGYIQSSTNKGRNLPTTAAKLAALDELVGIEKSIEFTAPCMKSVRAHAVLGFCHYVFWKRAGREAADNFMLKLIGGDNLSKGDPILYCRNKLPAMWGVAHQQNSRIELVFRCWNAHRLGHRIDRIKLAGGKLPKVER